MGKLLRAGLLSTNSIRSGASRNVLERIKSSGDIFIAWSDRPWILDGAAVRVSMIGFDNGQILSKQLDGQRVSHINTDLTTSVDLSKAQTLDENKDLCFYGSQQKAPFEINQSQAEKMLKAKNVSGRNNADVVKPSLNAQQLLQRTDKTWVIDFGYNMPLNEAELYEAPINYVKQVIYPLRMKRREVRQKEYWWLHARPSPRYRSILKTQKQYIVSPVVAKHRIFVWLEASILTSHRNVVFGLENNFFFGVLHSKLHELWSLRMGSWIGKGNDSAYTPSTTFETFPFPWSPGQEPSEADDARVKAIADWARALVAWRQAWLNPPPPQAGTIDVAYDKMLKKRTLTNLYNGLQYYRKTIGAGEFFNQPEFDKVTRKSVSRSAIEELHDIHTALDHAVLHAYGWPHGLTDEEILEHLLALNLERAAGQQT